MIYTCKKSSGGARSVQKSLIQIKQISQYSYQYVYVIQIFLYLLFYKLIFLYKCVLKKKLKEIRYVKAIQDNSESLKVIQF